MRGKASACVFRVFACGITPAYAGKSGTNLRSRSVSGDHPRVCGEKVGHTSLFLDGLGSPPRMRGKEGCEGHRAVPPGITPAYAGKS